MPFDVSDAFNLAIKPKLDEVIQISDGLGIPSLQVFGISNKHIVKADGGLEVQFDTIAIARGELKDMSLEMMIAAGFASPDFQKVLQAAFMDYLMECADPKIEDQLVVNTIYYGALAHIIINSLQYFRNSLLAMGTVTYQAMQEFSKGLAVNLELEAASQEPDMHDLGEAPELDEPDEEMEVDDRAQFLS